MSGPLLAWATDSGVRIYDTTTHLRVGRLQAPPSAADDPAAGASGGVGRRKRRVPPPPRVSHHHPPRAHAACTLFWLGERELYIGWARHVMVVRVLINAVPTSLQGAVPTRTLQASVRCPLPPAYRPLGFPFQR